jgi:uncharacterized membrane protein (DUF4010 family)
MLANFSVYLIAMSIGLIVGLERDRHARSDRQPMGIRTFILCALLGAISGSIVEPLVSLALVLFVAGAILLAYEINARVAYSTHKSIGLTTEIASMLTFSLGYLCNKEPILSLVLGIIMYLVLLNKALFHQWTKERLKPKELQAFATLLLLAIGVIPILPNHTIDPFDIFNPRRLGIIISLIATIQFIGYAAARLFGHRIGVPLAGFLSGTISATASFASYPKLAREKPEISLSFAAAASFAAVASLCQLLLLLSAISSDLALALSWPITLLVSIALANGIYCSQKSPNHIFLKDTHNPLNLLSAIKLGTLLAALIFLVEFCQRFTGPTFTQFIAFVGALFNLQGIGIATANMLGNNNISLNNATQTIMLAIMASMISKFFITLVLSKGLYKKYILRLTAALLAVSIIFYIIIIN